MMRMALRCGPCVAQERSALSDSVQVMYKNILTPEGGWLTLGSGCDSEAAGTRHAGDPPDNVVEGRTCTRN